MHRKIRYDSHINFTYLIYEEKQVEITSLKFDLKIISLKYDTKWKEVHVLYIILL